MAPVDGSSQNVSPGFAFQLVSEGKANDLFDVKKFRSSRTGLTVVIADVDGPVVNGYFCLATEAHDDDGLPHTLEHLIFLGSEQYPFKGVLDLLANRCLASGTNAWTDTDHTCYTMTTVGSEGFLSLMPIYLDHILYPTLSDQGFITEVHHISGDGRDNGVVYCEMQGRENSGESLCHLSMLRSLYPDCGYSSETGGIMKNLRESTDNIKVKKFHKDFYRPENLTLIITGKVKAEQVFSALTDMENKICSKGDRGAFIRPWQSAVQPFPKGVEQLVPYPCDEEDCGMIHIAWRGPSAVNDLYSVAACSIILKYLTDTAVSPLQRDLVEIKDPFASQVCYSLIENTIAALFVMFENVPVNKLDSVKEKFDQVMEQIISEKETIDMSRLESVINRQILETLSHLESNPHDTIAFMAIGDMLYGQNQKDFQQRLNNVQDLRGLLKEPRSYWIDLLKKYFGNGVPCVLIKGRPSIEMQVKMAEEEEERVKEQCKKLGENGLKSKGDALTSAIEHNEIPPPDAMLTSVPIPSTGGINFHTIESFTSTNSEIIHPNFPDMNAAGVMTHLINIKTNFVYLFALMDTSKISCQLRSYLPLLLETILESPLIRDGVIVPYETVVSELESDTIAASAKLGLETCSRFSCGPFGQTAVLLLQVEPGKYTRGVKWMQEILFSTQMTGERLSVVATKMINDVAQAKRNGNGIAIDILKSMLYCKESNQHCSNMIRQHRVLTELYTALEAGGDNSKTYLDQLNQLRVEITKPENLSLLIAANFESLENADQPWKQFLPPNVENSLTPLHVTSDSELISKCQSQRGSIVGLGCVESSFLKHCCPGLQGYKHEDLPALLVFTQYLTQLEGPLWKQVRGQGLAYGYNMFPQPNEGLLYFTLFKATNAVAAFNESKAIVEGQLKADAVWDETLFDSARSSLVFEIVEREKSVGNAVVHSLLSFFKGVPLDFNKEMVQRISKVTSDDLRRVGAKYVAPLFVPGSAHTSIVCHSSKVDEVAAAFSEMGFPVKIAASLEESPLA